jgi:ompA family protein
MKRLLFTLLAAITLITARAQYTAFPKFSDNWSATMAGGIVHPIVYEPQTQLLTHTFTMGMKKQLTSSFSLGLDLDYISWNNKLPRARYERTQILLVGGFNLGNLIYGYEGKPKSFDVEAKASAGWGHVFNMSRRHGEDANYLVSKFGVDFTYNFGSRRRWGIGVRPGVRFDLRNDGKSDYENFNANRAEFDISLGLTYRFGARKQPSIFEPPVTVSASQHDDLLEALRFLHKDVADRDATISQQNQRIAQLEAQLAQRVAAATTRAPKVSRQLETVISFGAGRMVVDAPQYPNVERVAVYLKKHPRARVVVRGYASPNGNFATNKRIAQLRAEAVKNLLIAQYGISKDRIDAAGQGVGDFFLEPEWNSVAICTITD